MSDDTLAAYRLKIRSLQQMTDNSFAHAIRQYRAGNEYVGRLISEGMLYVALETAERYMQSYDRYDPFDFIQEANAGLQDAIHSFSGIALVEFADFARAQIALRLDDFIAQSKV